MNTMRQGVKQRESGGSIFTLPPPEILPIFDDDEDEVEEDPFSVINELDKNKRQPGGFFGSTGGDSEPFVDPVTDDHALVPIDESPDLALAA